MYRSAKISRTVYLPTWVTPRRFTRIIHVLIISGVINITESKIHLRLILSMIVIIPLSTLIILNTTTTIGYYTSVIMYIINTDYNIFVILDNCNGTVHKYAHLSCGYSQRGLQLTPNY